MGHVIPFWPSVFFVLFVVRALCFIFSLFPPFEQRGGGGECAAKLFLLLSFPCSAYDERDWPTYKAVFRGGNQYAQCEEQQQRTGTRRISTAIVSGM